MSIVLATSITIAATPEQVWATLTDFSHYGEWSNFSRIDGTAVVGEKLTLRMPGMSFRSTVEVAALNRELRWGAKIISNGLFLGQHSFVLSQLDDGTTRLDNTETFSGLLVRPFRRLFAHNDNSSSGYAAFNRALKRRVEARG